VRVSGRVRVSNERNIYTYRNKGRVAVGARIT
jgi:hypothetical protein